MEIFEKVFNVWTYLLLKESVKTRLRRLDNYDSSDLMKMCLKTFQRSHVGAFVVSVFPKNQTLLVYCLVLSFIASIDSDQWF